MSTDQQPTGGPVTVIVRRRVAPAQTQAFEQWVAAISAICAGFPGYLSTDVIRPAAGASLPEYVTIIRFASHAQLKAWEDSPALRDGLAQAASFTLGEAQVQRAAGLEAWFSSPGGAAPVAPRWKMLLVLCVAIYPVSSLVGLLVGPLLAGLPVALITLVSLPLSMAIVSYGVLPWLTPLLAGWLYAGRT
jgi:antibiotic biosynthesis monooxygenase (ABM) superfamily enzyme